MIKISASTNPCDESKLLEYALMLQNYGVDYLHCDVMDGKFVKNIALSYELVRKLSFGCLLAMDVHLMVENPYELIDKYIEAKVNYLTVQYEVFSNEIDLLLTINKIKDGGLLAGLSIKPETKIEQVLHLLKHIDLLMIMSVEPGKSGQIFIEDTFKKFEVANKFSKEHNLRLKLQADGGVNLENKDKLNKLGVDIAVIGSALYNAKDRKEFIKSFKS